MLKSFFYKRIIRSFTTTSTNFSSMFCFQCEQTKNGTGCSDQGGQCGKSSSCANLQDLLTENIKTLSFYIDQSKSFQDNQDNDKKWNEIQEFTLLANYATLTNVNFDNERFEEYLNQCDEFYDYIENCEIYENMISIPRALPDKDKMDLDSLIEKGEEYGILSRQERLSEDIVSLQELIYYGLKGYAAYLYEASVLTEVDKDLYDFYSHAMGLLSVGNEEFNSDAEILIATAMAVGEKNVGVMAALDRGNNERFGLPVPNEILITPVEGKAILVSGHNIDTLEKVLEQTKDMDINVYTHGEMLPAHGYPEIRKYEHLVGNYGSAWQNQHSEFAKFPGSILMTTNCILSPTNKYKDRIFSHSIVGHAEVQHIEGDDFTTVIETALNEKGFKKTEEERRILTGVSHGYITSIADIIVEAVKDGKINHFWFIGGCDGVKKGRNYFTEIAESIPKDHVILTAGCGKYKINTLDHGVINVAEGVDIPRLLGIYKLELFLTLLLDLGQCNDSYGGVIVAMALAEAFGLESINDLPLSFVVSWFEQKAVVILLSLLHLGVKGITLGPSLPAFISPAILDFLVTNFEIAPIGDNVDDDIARILKK